MKGGPLTDRRAVSGSRRLRLASTSRSSHHARHRVAQRTAQDQGEIAQPGPHHGDDRAPRMPLDALNGVALRDCGQMVRDQYTVPSKSPRLSLAGRTGVRASTASNIALSATASRGIADARWRWTCTEPSHFATLTRSAPAAASSGRTVKVKKSPTLRWRDGSGEPDLSPGDRRSLVKSAGESAGIGGGLL